MENEEIEKQVSARLSDREIPIIWEHNGNTHYFKIPDIGKTESPQELQLSFGKKIVNGTETTIKIPGKSEFSVLDVRLNKNDRQSLRIDLSDNVDPTRTWKDLLQLRVYPIYGTKLKVIQSTCITPSIKTWNTSI